MSIGAGQLILIVLAILILFGAGKLPNVMADLAKGIRAFKKGMQEENDPQSLTLPHGKDKTSD